MTHRSNSFRDPRRAVVRKLAPANLAIGVIAVVGATVMVYAFWRMGHIPAAMNLPAAVMVAGGLYLVARPFAPACAACGRTLKVRCLRLPPDRLASATAALRSGDIINALRASEPAATAGAFAEFWYCDGCGGAAAWKAGGARIVLGGEQAKAMIDVLVRPAPRDEDSREPGAEA